MTKKETPVETLSYEQAFSELEEIVARMESEQPPLEEALALFERGQKLSLRCAELLENARLKVEHLTEDDLASHFEAELDE